jgi:hypothetical protein
VSLDKRLNLLEQKSGVSACIAAFDPFSVRVLQQKAELSGTVVGRDAPSRSYLIYQSARCPADLREGAGAQAVSLMQTSHTSNQQIFVDLTE